MTAPDDRLLLGPLLRYVDETSAAIWVETAAPATVTVTRGAASATAQTFLVHGHHYALVELDGLAPGSTETYTVSVDGEQVWPEAGSPFPEPVIATLECVGTDEAMRTAFAIARPGSTVGFVGVPHGVELPVRRYLPDLLDRVLSGAVDPGKVFDLTLPMSEAPEGYRAMDERRAIKVLLQP